MITGTAAATTTTTDAETMTKIVTGAGAWRIGAGRPGSFAAGLVLLGVMPTVTGARMMGTAAARMGAGKTGAEKLTGATGGGSTSALSSAFQGA